MGTLCLGFDVDANVVAAWTNYYRHERPRVAYRYAKVASVEHRFSRWLVREPCLFAAYHFGEEHSREVSFFMHLFASC